MPEGKGPAPVTIPVTNHDDTIKRIEAQAAELARSLRELANAPSEVKAQARSAFAKSFSFQDCDLDWEPATQITTPGSLIVPAELG